MFKDTNSDGLVSLQFLCALGIFSGVDKSIPKSTITELYRNLSYETFSGARDLSFPAVSDLILEVNFQIKHSTLLNRKRKEEDNECNLKLRKNVIFSSDLINLRKNWQRTFLILSNIKKLNIPTLNHKFRILKQQKQKQRKRTMNPLISNENLMRQKMLQLNKKQKKNDLMIYLMTLQMKIILSTTK